MSRSRWKPRDPGRRLCDLGRFRNLLVSSAIKGRSLKTMKTVLAPQACGAVRASGLTRSPHKGGGHTVEARECQQGSPFKVISAHKPGLSINAAPRCHAGRGHLLQPRGARRLAHATRHAQGTRPFPLEHRLGPFGQQLQDWLPPVVPQSCKVWKPPQKSQYSLLHVQCQSKRGC